MCRSVLYDCCCGRGGGCCSCDSCCNCNCDCNCLCEFNCLHYLLIYIFSPFAWVGMLLGSVLIGGFTYSIVAIAQSGSDQACTTLGLAWIILGLVLSVGLFAVGTYFFIILFDKYKSVPSLRRDPMAWVGGFALLATAAWVAVAGWLAFESSGRAGGDACRARLMVLFILVAVVLLVVAITAATMYLYDVYHTAYRQSPPLTPKMTGVAYGDANRSATSAPPVAGRYMTNPANTVNNGHHHQQHDELRHMAPQYSTQFADDHAGVAEQSAEPSRFEEAPSHANSSTLAFLDRMHSRGSTNSPPPAINPHHSNV